MKLRIEFIIEQAIKAAPFNDAQKQAKSVMQYLERAGFQIVEGPKKIVTNVADVALLKKQKRGIE